MDAWTGCDVGGCNARAYVEYALTAGPLYTCAHHATEYDDTLGRYIKHDHRKLLTAR